jgi:radical SAM superfamily enzyme YgiQ (UPF0313 family)
MLLNTNLFLLSMKILLVYPPFCTPAAPPYSITNIYAFLKSFDEFTIDALDLNIFFHKAKFEKYKDYYRGLKKNYDAKEYLKITSEFRQESKLVYGTNNKKVVAGKKPELFDELFDEIIRKKPDVVAFSIVYSSQVFYAYALMAELNEMGIKTAVGGPAVNDKLKSIAGIYCKNKVELYEQLAGKKFQGNDENILDYNIHDLEDYFVPEIVLPLKTSNTCYYKQCTYCTHYDKDTYKEFDLGKIRRTVELSGAKHFFLVDEMIPKKRLLEIAKIFAPLNIRWTCQLRPTKELDYETLKTLHDSGLAMLMWGVESGNDRILGLIRKGTNVHDIERVLSDSSKAGIKNTAYMIFGFPSETKQEFLQTIDFLKKNSENIDLVSTSVFGLQKGTPIFCHPKEYGIKKIELQERTMLEPKIMYELENGLTSEQASILRKKFRLTLEKIDKYPKLMNFFREHMLCLIENI